MTPLGAPVQVAASSAALTSIVLPVARSPRASSRSTVIDTVLDPLLTVFGESLPTTASLFATPTICVVSEAWIPAIVELSALTANWHTPGVLVTLTAKSTRPWLATIPTDRTPPIEQVPALDDQRHTRIVVRLALFGRM